MSFLEGSSIMRLAELKGQASGVALMARKRLGQGIIAKVAEAWGHMFFKSDVFHAVSRSSWYPLLSGPFPPRR